MNLFPHDTAKAQKAVKAAQRRGLPVPDEIPAVAAMVDVAVKAAHMSPPERPTPDDIPTTVEALAALLEERAHQHRIALAHQAVGTDFLEPIARRFNGLVRDQVPGWIRALQLEFNPLIKQLRAQSKKLPANLDTNWLDWNDPAVTGPWEKAEGIAFQLDQIVADRKDMAQAGGLAGEGGKDSELYAIAKLPEPTVEGVVQHRMRTHISPEMQSWRELRRQPVSRWLALVRSEHLVVELATPDEVRQRAAVWDRWREGIAARGVAPVPGAKAIKAVEAALRG